MTNTLILLRHGQSEWNEKNLFTGWVDVRLTEKGRGEAANAGVLLAEAGLLPDVLHTSVLSRAIQTANLALEAADRMWIPVRRSWRLNERHYGALQGLNKAETTKKFGEDQVKVWRRSYSTPPPPLDINDPSHPRFERRYEHLDPVILPSTESLSITLARVMPYWSNEIVPHLRQGKTVLVAAHGNSLRALVKHLNKISDDDIVGLNIPTGIPRIYELDDELGVISDRYLADEEKVQAAAAAVAAQAKA